MSSHLSQECTRAQEVDKSLSAMGGVAQLSQRPESQQFKQPHPLASNSHRHVRPAGPKRSRRQQKKNSQTQGEEPRRSYRTFGLEKCREIDRDNLLLVKNLAAISLRRQPMFGPPATKPKAKKKGDKIKLTMSLNRRKVEDRIARENLAFAERLSRVQGTRELTADVMRREAKLQRKYVKQCRRNMKDQELELWG